MTQSNAPSPHTGRRDDAHETRVVSSRTPAKRWWVERLARRFPVVDVIREDLQVNDGIWQPGGQAVVCHRLVNWVRSEEAPRVLRRPVGLLGRVGLYVSRVVYGIELPAEVTLGRRVKVAHQSGIVIHGAAVIDDDVLIRQNVTIGLRGDDDEGQPSAAPHIGKGVTLGAGAVVVGPIEVREGSWVGANAVVTQDVPAGGKAVAPRVDVQPAGRGMRVSRA
jgi:serine O-acetyltransferase